jgi:UDP-GlcNAc:undecaprenyl-phosphate/decaprenyl-phosphate GlcNAc-1-phosphate transferase
MFFEFALIALLSASLNYSIVRLAPSIKLLSNKDDFQGVQKFHNEPTPRVGGLAIFISFSLGIFLLQDKSNILLILWLASLPVFIGGLIEDLILNTTPLTRMLFIFMSIIIAFLWLDIGIVSLDFELTDYLLSNYTVFSFLFTLLVVSGVVNSINIIDGYNGLMVGYSMLVLLAMAYVASLLGDTLIVQLSLLLISSLSGLFIFNFPFGKIFMGDGGAYFVGFMMAIIGLMLGIRNEEVSHWFILLLFIYPLYETAFSIYRKKIVRNIPSSQPDGHHLHMLIYKRLVKCKTSKKNKILCNGMTSPFLWALSLVGIIPAVVWYNNQIILIIWAFIFMIIYTIIYRRIVHFKFKFRK